MAATRSYLTPNSPQMIRKSGTRNS
jgi:hypothetical protein